MEPLRTIRRAGLAVVDAMDPVAGAPGRTTSGAAGAMIAAAALMLAIAYGFESRAELEGQLARLDGTRISVTSSRTGSVTDVFPASTLDRVASLPGVEHVGLSVALGTRRVSRPEAGVAIVAPVYALSEGALEAIGAPAEIRRSLAPPRTSVAVVGLGARRSLGLAPLGTLPTVRLLGAVVPVVGVATAAPAVPQLLSGVALPLCCHRGAGPARTAELIVDTHPAVTQEVSKRLPQLIDPGAPGSLTLATDASPRALRRGVEHTLQRVTSIVAAAALVLGALVNGLLRYVTVRERRSEFGLRAALGARRSDLLLQVVAESTLVALLGSGIGVVIGAAGASTLAASSGHGLGVTASGCALALAAGVLTGVLAGLPPAGVAARYSPARALRS